MNKKEFLSLMEQHGDALIYYINSKNKEKYFMGTMDFSTKFIAEKPRQDVNSNEIVVVFCWDTCKFKQVKVDRVYNVVPLSRILQNDIDDNSV